MRGYLTFVLARVQACLDHRAYPYERRVCLWETRVIATCTALGAIAFTAPVWLGWVLGYWPSHPVVTTGLVLVALYLAHSGAWWTWFAWVDLGPGEWWRSLFFGAPYVPNISTETMEKFLGFKRGRSYSKAENDALAAAWDADKFKPLARWQGDPGSGRFDVLPADERTWAVRLHHRHVRPRLVAAGVRGYELPI